jgi:type II secretory pathway pseudopilin PulG
MTSPASIPSERAPGTRAGGGFTIIEIILALAIVIILVGIGGLALTGVNAQRALESRMSALENLARIAHTAVLRDQEPWLVIFEKTRAYAGPVSSGVALNALQDPEAPRPLHVVEFDYDETLLIRRTAWKEFLRVDIPEIWRFAPRSLLEPIEIRVESDHGWVQARFDPLTARLEEMEMEGR